MFMTLGLFFSCLFVGSFICLFLYLLHLLIFLFSFCSFCLWCLFCFFMRLFICSFSSFICSLVYNTRCFFFSRLLVRSFACSFPCSLFCLSSFAGLFACLVWSLVRSFICSFLCLFVRILFAFRSVAHLFTLFLVGLFVRSFVRSPRQATDFRDGQVLGIFFFCREW